MPSCLPLPTAGEALVEGLPANAVRAPLSLPETLRLGLFQACLGCLAVIFAGLLNRVMLTELGFPGLLVGTSLAFEQFVAPSRVLFGQISDSHPLARRHRVPYVLLGTALFCGLAVMAVPLIFGVSRVLHQSSLGASALAVLALGALFACYGLAVSLATTPYLALVIDRTSEQQRSRAVGVIWCMLTVGIVVGAILISLSLRSLDGIRDPQLLESTLSGFMAKVAMGVMGLTVIATWGMESPDHSRGVSRGGHRDDGVTLHQAWTLIRSSRQVLIFFSFLILFTLALFLQDPVLESYGAQVFGMAIAATAQLNAFWGVGTLVGLLVAGAWIVPWLGKLATARLGCQLIALSLLLLLLSGITASVPALQVVMVLFGLAAGIGTNGALCLMLDLTLPEVAGTFVGVWGLAQALSRAMGKVIGGGLLDLGHALSALGSMQRVVGPYPAYALVLGIELLVALAALLMLQRVNVRQFRDDTGRSLAKVLTLECS
jgi:BCD family chlorophyll transporter-like MFS transporter